MKEVAQKHLQEALARHGWELVSDDLRCEAVLRELCGAAACRLEVNLLMAAVRSGAVSHLLEGGGGDSPEALEIRLAQRVCDEFGVTGELARWSVRCWMAAFGIAVGEGPGPAGPAGAPEAASAGGEVTELVDPPMAVDVDEIDLGGGETLSLSLIPPGSFIMGSPESEAGRYADETPHKVVLTRGFWLGRHPVTQGQWKRVMGTDPSQFKGARNPVERVSWDDGLAFLRKLNDLHGAAGRGGRFRLPGEAEWEYACRAGTTGPFAGDLDALAWHAENSGKRTHPAGGKKANDWGLHDMHGNVGEWCADWYGEYPRGGAANPAGPITGTDRVCRGGAWGNRPAGCRSAARGRNDPHFKYGNLGFRVARDLRASG